MAKKQSIQTSLLGVYVEVHNAPATQESWQDRRAQIVSVFLDSDKEPKYTLVNREGELANFWHHSFRVLLDHAGKMQTQ